MSNISLIIEERARQIGNFTVGRLLPFHSKRMVGPFIFIDHMGPVAMNGKDNIDIPPHPHIGLSTLTYLFEGAIMHRDSQGNAVEITPGQVNWMTAGKGIVHSERTPEHLRQSDKIMHGLQIWVGLPKDLEQMEPSFFHMDADELPEWSKDHVQYRLIAGHAMGKHSPVPVYSPLFLIEIKADADAEIDLGPSLYGEVGIYILQGQLENDGHVYDSKKILVAANEGLCTFKLTAGSAIYVFGGEPFPEERFMYWNFVATNKALLEAAKERWALLQFPKIEGETDFVPLPEEKRH